MYSMVMMMAMAQGGDVATFGGRKGCNGCDGGGCHGAVVMSCHGGGHSCMGSSCNGCDGGGCHGKRGGGLFSRMRAKHSCHGCDGGSSCHGCSGGGSCHGGEVMVHPAPVMHHDACALPAHGAPVMAPPAGAAAPAAMPPAAAKPADTVKPADKK